MPSAAHAQSRVHTHTLTPHKHTHMHAPVRRGWLACKSCLQHPGRQDSRHRNRQRWIGYPGTSVGGLKQFVLREETALDGQKLQLKLFAGTGSVHTVATWGPAQSSTVGEGQQTQGQRAKDKLFFQTPAWIGLLKALALYLLPCFLHLYRLSVFCVCFSLSVPVGSQLAVLFCSILSCHHVRTFCLIHCHHSGLTHLSVAFSQHLHPYTFLPFTTLSLSCSPLPSPPRALQTVCLFRNSPSWSTPLLSPLPTRLDLGQLCSFAGMQCSPLGLRIQAAPGEPFTTRPAPGTYM